MRMRSASMILALTWLVGFGVILIAGYIIHYNGRIGDVSFQSFLDQTNRTFEHYVGIVLGFLLSSQRARNAGAKCGIVGFLAAVVVTIGWITMVGYNVFDSAVGHTSIQAAMKQVETNGSRMAWLVAPVMGYYFGDRVKDK